MTIQLIQSHVTRIKNGKARVKPGQPYRINEAASAGDGVWQGDLGIEIIERIPVDYVNVTSTTSPIALVPGDSNTVGSRHSIKDASTVSSFWRPKQWTDESLLGPAFHCREETTITHPVHGDVVIAKGHTIRVRYQRNWDAEQKRERRAVD